MSEERMEIKTISLPGALWAKALKKARSNSQSLSAVIRRFLDLWVRDEIELPKK